MHYGFPERLHSDQGRNFESAVIKHLCELAGIAKTRTTPYHPMSNGMCERFNRTLLHMLGTLDESQKTNWKEYVAPVVHAYNCTQHSSTGISPFYLMFGRHPRLAVDVYFGLGPNTNSSKDHSKFIQDLSKRLEYAYELARRNAASAGLRQKATYDRRPPSNRIEIGDKVLVKNFTPNGKLDNFWETDIYEVMAKPNPEIPVYVVRREDGVGRKKTLHRNNLKLCPLPVGSNCPDTQIARDPLTEGGELDEVPQRKPPQLRRSARAKRKPKWMDSQQWKI